MGDGRQRRETGRWEMGDEDGRRRADMAELEASEELGELVWVWG